MSRGTQLLASTNWTKLNGNGLFMLRFDFLTFKLRLFKFGTKKFLVGKVQLKISLPEKTS
jgi:hypothetical protein